MIPTPFTSVSLSSSACAALRVRFCGCVLGGGLAARAAGGEKPRSSRRPPRACRLFGVCAGGRGAPARGEISPRGTSSRAALERVAALPAALPGHVAHRRRRPPRPLGCTGAARDSDARAQHFDIAFLSGSREPQSCAAVNCRSLWSSFCAVLGWGGGVGAHGADQRNWQRRRISFGKASMPVIARKTLLRRQSVSVMVQERLNVEPKNNAS